MIDERRDSGLHPIVAGAGRSVQFELRSGASVQHSVPPFHVWTSPDGSIWAEFIRLAESFVIRFPELAQFTISNDGMQVFAEPLADVDTHTLQHLYLNQVLPLALQHQGQTVFHASGVALGGKAIAFVGNSGQGKSTLATFLGLHGDAQLITDDGLLLQPREAGFDVFPTAPAVRLWEDSREALLPSDASPVLAANYTTKGRFLSDGLIPFAAQPVPLARTYFLGNGTASDITITQLGAQAAHMAWIRHSFMLDVQDKARMASHFAKVESLVALGISYVLDYPRRYDVLPEVAKMLRMHVG